MKNVLENKTDHPSEHLGVTSIEPMMLAIVRWVHLCLHYLMWFTFISASPFFHSFFFLSQCEDNINNIQCCYNKPSFVPWVIHHSLDNRYVRHLDTTVHTLHIKTKLCQLVEVMMQRRDDLAFRQEMKFRNKMVDYLTDWVMGNSHQIAPPGTIDVATVSKWVGWYCMLEMLIMKK